MQNINWKACTVNIVCQHCHHLRYYYFIICNKSQTLPTPISIIIIVHVIIIVDCNSIGDSNSITTIYLFYCFVLILYLLLPDKGQGLKRHCLFCTCKLGAFYTFFSSIKCFCRLAIILLHYHLSCLFLFYCHNYYHYHHCYHNYGHHQHHPHNYCRHYHYHHCHLLLFVVNATNIYVNFIITIWSPTSLTRYHSCLIY